MLTILGAATALAVHAPAEPPCRDRRSLIQFADAFDRAQLAKDAAALGRMTADGLIFIDGSGKRLGKRDFIAGWTDPGDRFAPVVLHDRQVIALGPNAGIVTADAVLSGVSGGKPFSSRFRFSDTFRCTGGGWQAVHIQVTRVPAEPKP
jgi:ketosteroid isomerase-like protein